MVQPYFGPWDYVVLVIVLCVSSAIGLYYRFTGGKQQTTQEYLLADRKMSITPVAFSLVASFMSAITLLGVSSENYTFGFHFIVINLSYVLFTPVAVYLYLPVFFRLQATSTYEYLEKRFGKATRLAASLCYTCQMVFYMGMVLYAPALALEALTGINRTAAILSVGLVCTFYSTIGGMKAVLMTDVFQSLLMFAAVLCVVIYAVVDKGSFGEIWRIASEGGRTDLLNFNPDPTVRHTWFTLIIGGGVTFLSLYAVNQTQVQRYLTVKDLGAAQRALWLNLPILGLLSLSTSFAGLAIYSRYYKCDPVAAGVISSSDQLMPLYVVETMSDLPGMSGLFVAGIFSASLSTVSAAVNSLAAVTIEDYYKPVHRYLFKRELTDKTATYRSKIIALIYGFICLAMAFLAQFLGGLLQAALTIFGVVGGPLLAVFTLGMFTTTANEPGALTGLAAGLALALWMAFGGTAPLPKLPISTDGCENSPNITIHLPQNTTYFSGIPPENEVFWLHRVSYLYNGVLGLLGTFLIGWIISYLFEKFIDKNPRDVDPNLFIRPIARRLEKRMGQPLNMKNLNDYSDEDLKNGNNRY